MWKITIVGYMMLMSILPTPARSETPLLRGGEVRENTDRNGLSTRDCIVIYDSGRFHLERRRQQMPGVENKLTVYESVLTPAQMKLLEEVLSSLDLKTLPRYIPPKFPLNVSTYSIFTVTINRNNELYNLGYFDWANSRSDGSPASTPEQVKQDWQLSKDRLQAIKNWLHELETSDLVPTDSPSDSCHD